MQYKVLEKSFIDNAIQEPGAIVELPEGVEPGPNLEAVDPLDHDADGKKGGSRPKAPTAPEA